MVGHDYPCQGLQSLCFVQKAHFRYQQAGAVKIVEPAEAPMGDGCDQIGLAGQGKAAFEKIVIGHNGFVGQASA